MSTVKTGGYDHIVDAVAETNGFTRENFVETVIEKYSFGKIVVNGLTYTNDIKKLWILFISYGDNN